MAVPPRKPSKKRLTEYDDPKPKVEVSFDAALAASGLADGARADGRQTTGSLILSLFAHAGWTEGLAQRFRNDPAADIEIDQLGNPSVKALLVASLFEDLKQPIVLVAPDAQAATRYQAALEQYLPARAIHRYPTETFSPYDLSIVPTYVLRQHYGFLEAMESSEAGIYIVPARSLLIGHPSLEERRHYALKLEADADIAPEAVVERCLAMGYTAAGLILEPGEISRRGDIVDVYPVNADPVRISFFGDTVESIRVIDVDTQRSIQSVERICVYPRSTLVLTPENKASLTEQIQTRLAAQKADLSALDFEGLSATVENQLQALEQDFWPDGIDYYAPLIHGTMAALSDAFPESALLVLDDWHVLNEQIAGLSDRLENQLKEGVEKGRLLDLGAKYHITRTEAMARLKERLPRRLLLESFAIGEGETAEHSLYRLQIQASERFQADLPKAIEHFKNLRREGVQIFITTDYPQRVLDSCRERDLPAVYWSETDPPLKFQMALATRDVLISKAGPPDGFVLPELRIAHWTDAEVFGRRRVKRPILEGKASKRDDVDVIQNISELRQGDYIVHSRHGIGQFVEIAKITIDGETREYLSIQYSGGDKLHVPAEQVNMLSRYRGAGEAPPKLSKMGGIEWSSVKKKVKKSLASIAGELIKLYAIRSRARGFTFEGDTPWQVEMEEAFPYSETPDQWQSILDVKHDMESDKPMDRLICGDVGFGKTEVALRGIFKCVLSGKQAALLVPTTILAQQHFNTLVDRFQPYPVRMGLLSRFRSPKEQKEVVDRMARGEVDIVVGTHRLLQKDIRFKDLGLLVIDEEHRFGVAHKEKIKQLRTQVDVLTMSATPIPRTLYMSLSGVRDMSLINTPPTNRAPVQTFVGPYNPAQIRMAILHEVDRGGQVYFVHNRVQTIYQVAEELKQLIPEVTFGIGHGQMNETDLENVMLGFAQHEFDVLLATTIIESGLDIPNANTMIIDRADRFGLAQLYQLRGRVGRSDIQAYAYCYYDPEKMLSEDAKNRLRAIRELTSLGSGYQIALRDMEIRGVGNILGSEQHGHMIAIGFDMYCEMLKEAIEAAQTGEEVKEKPEPSIIDLNVTAFIPDEWVGDRDVKLTEYKRLAGIESEVALDIILAEWKDRFGEIPAPAKQLVELARLRIMATDMALPLVRTDDEYLRVSVPYSLQEWMKLQSKLPPALGNKLRWVAPVRSMETSMPTLLAKATMMSGAEQVAFLTKLFRGLESALNDVQSELAASASPAPQQKLSGGVAERAERARGTYKPRSER
jgi:transcription-repair coupling factor (superfamily II helicase)